MVPSRHSPSYLTFVIGVIVCWCTVPVSAVAVEQRIADVRVVADARPTAFDFTWDDALGTHRGTDSFTRAGDIGLGGRWAWGAAGQSNLLIAGLDLLWVDEASDTLRRRGPLARGELGWGIGIADSWVLTALPGLGVGRAEVDIAQGAGITVTGMVLEPSLRGGLRWNVDRRVALGLEAGWLWGHDHLAGDGAQLDIDRSGGWVGLSLAWQLDLRPRRLE